MNIKNLNLVALAVNISRVYEIATLGGHTVKIVPTEHGSLNDAILLSSFYGFGECHNPDIIVELAYSPDDVLNCFASRCETIEDINERIPKTQIEIPDLLDNSSMTLLKTAVSRLQLGVTDVLTIHKLAKTIAQLGGSDKIKVEHIAEAIQYRSSSNH